MALYALAVEVKRGCTAKDVARFGDYWIRAETLFDVLRTLGISTERAPF